MFGKLKIKIARFLCRFGRHTWFYYHFGDGVGAKMYAKSCTSCLVVRILTEDKYVYEQEAMQDE